MWGERRGLPAALGDRTPGAAARASTGNAPAVTEQCGGGWAASPRQCADGDGTARRRLPGARMVTVVLIVATVGVGLGQGSRTAPPARRCLRRSEVAEVAL